MLASHQSLSSLLFFSKFSVLVESSSASCNILPETVTRGEATRSSRTLASGTGEGVRGKTKKEKKERKKGGREEDKKEDKKEGEKEEKEGGERNCVGQGSLS
jgi:hypothetical protein